MNIGLYQSAASLSALERWQDAVAQNITSSQVPGYRKRTVEFSSQSLGQWQPGSGSNSGDNAVPAVFPKASNGISFLMGETQPTGRDFDLAIQGPGFFEIQAPDGSHTFTRSGEFSVRADNTLVNNGGGEVLSDSGSPITLSAQGGKVTIKSDGTIVQGQTVVGKVGVQSFANSANLTPVGGGSFVDNGAGAQPVDKPQILQGYVEASNVTPMREMVDLVLITRSYEANQKIIKTADENAQKELDALG